MKSLILFFLAIGMNWFSIFSQEINGDDIKTTCFVLSELADDAIKNGDMESILIYINAFDKIKENFEVNEAYVTYFNSIKRFNPNLDGIVIFINTPPKSPGFTNNEIDNFILLKEENISLADFNNFLLIKKLGEGKIDVENMNEFEIKNIEKIKNEIELIDLKQ